VIDPFSFWTCPPGVVHFRWFVRRPGLWGTPGMKFRVLIDRERCKGCGLCVDACERKVLRMSHRLNATGYHYAETARPEDCSGCRRCVDICPECGMEVRKEES